jgi:hypothetical protein
MSCPAVRSGRFNGENPLLHTGGMVGWRGLEPRIRFFTNNLRMY